jgi:hypothetical protein
MWKTNTAPVRHALSKKACKQARPKVRVVVSPPGMTGSPGAFGDLLRLHRQAVGLTQLALAEPAGLSVHGIQKLEDSVGPQIGANARLAADELIIS